MKINRSFSFIILSICLSSSQMTHADENNDTSHVASETMDPQNSALNEVLTYIRPHAYSYRIESPWFVKGPKESDVTVLRSVENHLRERFSIESNARVQPSWINSQSITFERRVECDERSALLVRDLKESIKSRSQEGYRGHQSESGRSKVAAAQGASSEHVSLFQTASAQESYNSRSGERFQTSGYTVTTVSDKVWETSCKKSHIEFRGVLQAERVLYADSTEPFVKQYLVARAINALTHEFQKTLNKYVIHLDFFLNNTGISETAVESLKLQTEFVNSGSSGISSYFSSQLIAMISAQRTLKEIQKTFADGEFHSMARYAQKSLDQVQFGLRQIAEKLQPYGRTENVVEEKAGFGRKNKKTIASIKPVIAIGISQQTTGATTVVTLFRESELQNLFQDVLSFRFMGEKMDPSILQVNAAKNLYQGCVDTFNKLRSSGPLYQNNSAIRERVKACTEIGTAYRFNYTNLAIQEAQANNCLGLYSEKFPGEVYNLVFVCLK